MISSLPLTEEQRRKSQFNYYCFNLINGASYMCLGETVIVLFAVRLDMQNTVISLIGAMLYLGYLLLPLGVIRTAKVGAAQSQADYWVCRNIAALLVAASVAVNQFSHFLAGVTLLLGAFAFYGFRAAGCVMAQPLVGDITLETERSVLIARSTAFFYLTGTVALLIISTILHFYDSLPVLVGIIIAGAAMGITASRFIRNILETDMIQKSAQQPFFSGLVYVLKTAVIRRLIVAWFSANLCNLLIVPMSILALKRGSNVSDTNAILFSLAQFGFMIFASQMGIPLTKIFGPRKMGIYGFLLYFPVALFWVFLPDTGSFSLWQWFFVLIPFLLQGAATVLVTNAMIHYFLMAVPKENQVNATMLANLITGAAAGIVGMGIAYGLTAMSEYLAAGQDPQNIFRWYFGIAVGILLLSLPLMLRLKTIINKYKEEHSDEELHRVVTHHPPKHRT